MNAARMLVDALGAHLLVLPIVLPLAVAALMLALPAAADGLRRAIGLVSALAQLAIAAALMAMAGEGSVRALPMGDWPAPFGIVLALDRLSATMVLLVAVTALAALMFAAGDAHADDDTAAPHRRGRHVQPLFQLQCAGLNGAFLTADLFNLFVCFEVLLIASYGLLLHGGGPRRIVAGLHYVTLNLVGSALFLIALGLLYAVTGTLSMADLAQRLPAVAATDRGLLGAGLALLALVFALKAAAFPVNGWLPGTYSAAAAPSAALFAVLTKVGLYALLRTGALAAGLAGDGADGAAEAGWLTQGLRALGLVTLVGGTVGLITSATLARIGGWLVVVSAGLLLAALGTTDGRAVPGALLYLVSSTLACALLFLMSGLYDRPDAATGGPLRVPAIAGGLALVVTAMWQAGLPPTAGFVAKLAVLDGVLPAGSAQPAAGDWATLALVIGSGLATLAVLARTGARLFWAPDAQPAPRVGLLQALALAGLLAAGLALAVQGEAALRWFGDATAALRDAGAYGDAVLAPPAAPRAGH